MHISWGDPEASSSVMRRLCDHSVSLDPVPKVADQLILTLLALEDGLLEVRVTALTAALSSALSENSACEEVCQTVNPKP